VCLIRAATRMHFAEMNIDNLCVRLYVLQKSSFIINESKRCTSAVFNDIGYHAWWCSIPLTIAYRISVSWRKSFMHLMNLFWYHNYAIIFIKVDDSQNDKRCLLCKVCEAIRKTIIVVLITNAPCPYLCVSKCSVHQKTQQLIYTGTTLLISMPSRK
jgi:hypothetical protein